MDTPHLPRTNITVPRRKLFAEGKDALKPILFPRTPLKTPARFTSLKNDRNIMISHGVCTPEPQIDYQAFPIQEQTIPIYNSGGKRAHSNSPWQNRSSIHQNLKSTQNQVELFNPDFPKPTTRTLLEAMRDRVNNFMSTIFNPIGSTTGNASGSVVSDDDDAWNSEHSCHTLDLLRVKLPKETRNSILRKTPEAAVCTPILYPKMPKSMGAPKRVAIHKVEPKNWNPWDDDDEQVAGYCVPCPLNILCDRGIHLGKCDVDIQEKVQPCPESSKCCQVNSSCCKTPVSHMATVKVAKYELVDLIPTKLSFIRTPSANVKLPEVVPVPKFTSEKTLSPRDATKRDGSISPRLDNADNARLSDQPSTSTAPPLPTSGVSALSSGKHCQPVMNGMNGHANGELNGCGDIITQNQQKGCWTIGLINSKFRYLTAETFGFKINANGASLKKKQIWTLEPESPTAGDSMIYLRSHLDKYLAVDSFGNVTCESDEKDAGCQFQISVSEDGSGRWALKNVVRGYFLGSTQDKLTCTAKVPGDAEFWHIHLAARPQVNLRSVGRKRFAHLSENLDEIHVDANIPWGEDTLFTLEFRLEESGKYAIHTCNNKYLSMSGKLVDVCNKDCFFSAEYHSGQLALRDRTGQYLSPIGSKAVLKTRSNTVTKDELFSLEDSLPQASFVASLNSRFVSVKQGVDVTANQDEISDHETFQLEFDWSTKRWYIRTMQDRYWTLETGGGIQASGDKRSSNALFDLVWQTDGSLAFRANNGRYVITKRSGHLYATSDAIDDTCKYFFYLINRPILVLKCEQGFVGYKAASNPKLECNKATYECIQVERGEKGVVFFKGQNGKYWHVDSEGVTADSDTQEGFYLELREPTRLCIKSINGNYLTASKNGLFRLGDTSIENATQWEY